MIPSLTGLAADTVKPGLATAVQMLADMTLIDGACRAMAVDFGRAFKASEADGVRAGDVMPAGELRPAFEAATRQRLAQTSQSDLCGPLAARYAADLPGLFIQL